MARRRPVAIVVRIALHDYGLAVGGGQGGIYRFLGQGYASPEAARRQAERLGYDVGGEQLQFMERP